MASFDFFETHLSQENCEHNQHSWAFPDPQISRSLSGACSKALGSYIHIHTYVPYVVYWTFWCVFRSCLNHPVLVDGQNPAQVEKVNLLLLCLYHPNWSAGFRLLSTCSWLLQVANNIQAFQKRLDRLLSVTDVWGPMWSGSVLLKHHWLLAPK